MCFCCWYMSSSSAAFNGGFCRWSCSSSCCCLSTFSSSARSRHWWRLAAPSQRPSRSFSLDRPVPRGSASRSLASAGALRRWSLWSWAGRWWSSDSWSWQLRTCRWSSHSRSSLSVTATVALDAMTSPDETITADGHISGDRSVKWNETWTTRTDSLCANVKWWPILHLLTTHYWCYRVLVTSCLLLLTVNWSICLHTAPAKHVRKTRQCLAVGINTVAWSRPD